MIEYSKIFWDTELLKSTIKLLKKEDIGFYLDNFSKISNIKWDFEIIITYYNNNSNYYWLSNIIKNKTIELNFKILRNNINKLDNKLFSKIQVSNDLFWDNKLIKEFFNYIDFDVLSESENVEWSNNLLDEFQENLNFKILSKNYSIIITTVLLNKYSDKWDFKYLSNNKSVCWDLENIEEFIHRIDFDEIITNSKINFTADFIEKYKNMLTWNGRWRKFGRNNEFYYASNISQQRHLPISVKTLAEMTTEWGVGCTKWSSYRIDNIQEWYYYSENYHLTAEHLNTFKEFFSWEILSKNQELKITKELLTKYANKWNYFEILKRDDIDWDIQTFCKISNYLNWDLLKGFENKILDILQYEKNSILNYFTFIGNNSNLSLHDEKNKLYRYDNIEKELRVSKMIDICSEALNESKLLNLNDYYELWDWLKKYIKFYNENTNLSPDFNRTLKHYGVDSNKFKTETIKNFISKYKKNKLIFDKIHKEKKLLLK